jgi:hypothetical protein
VVDQYANSYSMVAAERFALLALGRAWTLLGSRKKLEARKMLENAAEFPASGARFVGRQQLLLHLVCLDCF